MNMPYFGRLSGKQDIFFSLKPTHTAKGMLYTKAFPMCLSFVDDKSWRQAA